MRWSSATNLIVVRMKSWSLLISLACGLAIAMIIVLNFFNPLEIGPNGILAFFAILYLFFTVIALLLLRLWRLLLKKQLSATKMLYLAASLGFAPVMLVALNTLNQLQIIDIVLVLAFEVLSLFYILKRMN